MKKIISFSLMMALLLSFLPINEVVTVAATADRGGYTLTPVTFGRSGIDVSTSFVLTTPNETTTEEVVAKLSIDGQPQPDIVAVSDNGVEFIISPAVILVSNTLYIFRVNRKGADDITWAFQTARRFQITSNFPRHEATNVPRNTGIEITFSEENFTPIDEFFSIYPHVAGRFEYRRNVVSFVPSEFLDFSTVYTVTLRAGVGLDGTNDVLTEDYIFSFETAPPPPPPPPPRPAGEPPPRVERIFFDSSYVELPSIQPPSIGYRLNFPRNTWRPTPDVRVYRFANAEQGIESAQRLMRTPRWSQHARERNFVDTRGMTQVMSFEWSIGDEERHWGRMEFPDNLPHGFYLIEASVQDGRDQMVIQISDLPIQIISDDEQSIVWVNDIMTGVGLANATVYIATSGERYTTDQNGIAVVNRAIDGHIDEKITVTARDGRSSVWVGRNTWSGRWHSGNANEAYWTALQLDRTLFQRDDTMFFWGFVECRRNSEDINYVTAVLRQSGWNRWSGTGRDILHRQVVPVQNGVYTDEIMLPILDTGGYTITIYHGEIALSTMHFEVQDYVKPPYEITVSADKRAVFVDDIVTFTAKAGFFEGTPLPDLSISYRLWGSRLNNSLNSRGVTNMDGEIEVTVTPRPQAATQGQTSLEFTAEATLPEIGLTQARTSVRVFVNDIHVRARATRPNEKIDIGTPVEATITVDVNSITLDRLNDGTSAHWNDFLDEPVNNQAISVDVYRQWWEKIDTGEVWERYDFIEKRVIRHPIYRWEMREERITNFIMNTNADGIAERNFTLPNRERESYFAQIRTTDGNRRVINQRVFIGRDWSRFFWTANENELHLYSDNESNVYAIGDEVTLTLKRGADVVERGNFLFVNMQRGIQSFQAGQNPYTFTFSREHIPNVFVQAYYFDGFTYRHTSWRMRENLRFDFEQNELIITATQDRETYQPGDMFNVIITATDIHGNPVSNAAINISVVDEALFALRDYTVNTLTSLYRTISAGQVFETSTHWTFIATDETRELQEYGVLFDMLPEDSMTRTVVGGGGGAITAPASPIVFSVQQAEADGGGNETHLREIFEDTAHFAVIHTNTYGQAVHSFQLPDNITSWRMTLSGISNDLHAGNFVDNIIVTNPMFLNYSINDTFLVGDIPTIGVNVFGTSLRGGETVSFEVWDEENPQLRRTASGVAFERVNIPLWEMENEGESALIIYATVNNGLTDAVRHQYQVLRTYREMDAATFYDVTVDTVFTVGNGGLTNITFTDRSRGQYLTELIRLRNSWGDRIERMVARREATRLIRQYFPDVWLWRHHDSFVARNYQQRDGGISILAHAESDLETTVRLMPFIKDEINTASLRNYLYGIFEGDNADNKMLALYGLAMLHEPVLLHLNNYAMLEAVSIRDLSYIALGFYALGETLRAAELYDTRIAPYLERFPPYYRVNFGINNDDILDATSAALNLATKLERPERDGLYRYLIRNRPTDILTNLERLTFIQREIGKATDISGSITYTLFGQEFTRELGRHNRWGGGSYTLQIPAANIHEFNLIEVTGDVGAVSIFRQPMTDVNHINNEITVRRRFYRIGGGGYSGSDEYTLEFEQGDIVRVNLWVDYSAVAIQGSYVVTDFLPAGLEFISDSARIPGERRFGIGHLRSARIEGQRVMFFDHNNWFNSGRLYFYYARVVSPGTFRAEGTMVQNLNAPTYFTVGEDDIIVIR